MFWLLLLVTGDVIDVPVIVKYSGEPYTWTATADAEKPGQTIEIEITERISGQQIELYAGPIVDGKVIYSADIPRLGLYDGRARACQVLCSEWVASKRMILAILAPPGAPEF